MSETFSANGHKRAVLYARVSTDEQAGNYSLPTQAEACRKYADKNGMVIVGEFSDDYSGATPIEARPEGRKAFTMLKSDGADCLIAYSVDRLVRPPEDSDEWDTPILIRSLAKVGKELHTVDRGLLKTDFASLLIAVLDAKGAGEERRKITERTSRGRNAKASSGLVVGSGHPPYGYRFATVEVKQKRVVVGLEINESEAAVIRDIYKWYVVDLLTGHEITRRLSEMHVITAGESGGYRRKRASGVWDKSVVHSVLANELYCGVWRYRKFDYSNGDRRRRVDGEVIEVTIPAIVSRETWELAQQRRKDGKKTSRRDNLFLLTGRIKCGCGFSMTGCNGRNHLYYGCGTIFHAVLGRENCHERRVRQDVIEPLAWEFALQSKKSAVEFVAMLKEYQEQQKHDTAPLAEQIAEVKTLLDTTARKIKRLAALRGSADDDDEAEQYTADLDAAKVDKTSQECKLHKLESEYVWTDVLTDDDILTVVEMRGRDLKELQGADFDKKRRYLAKIDLRVIVKDRQVTLTSKLPIPPKSVNLDNGAVVAGGF